MSVSLRPLPAQILDYVRFSAYLLPRGLHDLVPLFGVRILIPPRIPSFINTGFFPFFPGGAPRVEPCTHVQVHHYEGS